MTTQDHSHPRVENLISGFTEWLRHRRELNEMRQLDRNEFDRIANDLRVSPDELDELVRHGPHAADELPKLLKVLGIEEADLAAAQPLLLRDMERYAAGTRCRHRSLVEYFGETWTRGPCGACDWCLEELDAVEDSTTVARKILSCVARVRQSWGLSHVADVLLGTASEKDGLPPAFGGL